MPFKKTFLFLLPGLFLATSVMAVPANWGLFVPTGAQYLGSRSGAIGKEWGCSDCGGYDRTAIDHFKWYCCGACAYCPGYLCANDSAFDVYQLIGDYYDCEGNLLESGAPRGFRLAIIRGTGTIFDGGIGGGDEGYIVGCVPTWCSPARDCRIHTDMSPQLNYCPNGHPSVPPQSPEKNFGRPQGNWCDFDHFVGNPINVATGNKYEETVDLVISTPGIPLEFRRAYNSQSGYERPLGNGWTHNFNLWLEVLEDEQPKKVIVWEGDGRALHFHEVRQEPGSDDVSFGGESGVKDKLRKSASTGEYFLRRKVDKLTYRFDPEGRLIEISDPNENRLTLTYEGDILRQVSNNYGKILSFQYSNQGLLRSVKDPKGQLITYEYLNGALIKVTYPDGDSTNYTYLNQNLTGKYDTHGNLIGYWEYDQKNRVKTYYSHLKDGVAQNRIDLSYQFLTTNVTKSTGVTTYKIEMINGLSVVKEIEGCSECGSLKKRLDYDKRLNLVSVTSIRDGQEIKKEYLYDNPAIPWEQVGEVVEGREAIGWPEERTTRYTYQHTPDDPFLVTQRTEIKPSIVELSQNRTSTSMYDDKGNLLSQEETGYTLIDDVSTLRTHKTEYEYNGLGQLIWVDGPRSDLSDETTIEYYENAAGEGNNRGQVKAIINAIGHRTEYSEYDANGNVEKIKDPNAVITQYTYDQRNRVKAITNLASGTRTQFSYDNRGNLGSILLPEGNKIEFAYDLANHLTSVVDSLGNMIHFEYDQEGNRIREERTDPRGILRKYLNFAYDPYQRLKRMINPDGTFTEYTYDADGNRTSIQDPRGNRATYVYDALNRLVKMTQLAQSGDVISEYKHDSRDNLISVKDGNENRTLYIYDDFGNLIQILSPDAGRTTYLYDEGGNLIQKIDAKGTVVNYSYDALNRLTSINFPDPSENIVYSYDSPLVSYGVGRLTSTDDPSGTSVFNYDFQGNLVKEEKNIGTIIYTNKYGYNKNNSLTSLTYPSGRTVTYGLDRVGRESRVSALLNNNTKTLAFEINYLPYGGMTGLAYGNGLSLMYRHDLQYRVSSITVEPVLNRLYSHDPNGNIIAINDLFDSAWNSAAEKPETYTYEPGSNKLTQVGGEISTVYSYDPNGNTVSWNNRSYYYDHSNQITGVSENDALLAEYMYNGSGQRVMKILENETRVFHYDPLGHLIAETNEKGETLAEYVYLGDEPLAMIRNEEAYYYHNDHLGTPQALTDSTGKVVWKALYKPFGEIETVVEDVENPFLFPGQYYDKETGIHYNYFRYYNPRIGRYLTPDPIGLEGGINLFVYVASNPINKKDPSGLRGYEEFRKPSEPKNPEFRRPPVTIRPREYNPPDRWPPPAPSDFCETKCYIFLFIDYFTCNVYWQWEYHQDPHQTCEKMERQRNEECKRDAYNYYRRCINDCSK
jgi:RHS repeat-associated protein